MQLTAVIRPAVEALGFELLGCEYLPQGRHSLLRVYIDHDNGITIDDCARVSEQVSAVLDVEDVVSGTYSLEVSSPGIERPLFELAHFQKVLGQMVQVRLFVALDGRRNFKGILQQVHDEHIVILVDEQAFDLPISAIEKAHLVVDTW